MIQSEIKQETEQEQEYDYPLLMISKYGKDVVLMTSHGAGVSIYGSQHNAIGIHSKSWFMRCFKPFKGEITLKNK